MKALASPVEVTPGAYGSWSDIDVSTQLGADAGSVAGVMLQLVNTSATEYTWGIRKNGSTDTYSGVLEDTGHTWVAVGVDASDIFEVNLQNAAIEVYLLGYIMSSEGAFFTNAVDVTPVTTGAWTDVDISTATGGDTATVAFMVVDKGGSGGSTGGDIVAFRVNGSTDTHGGVHLFRGKNMGACIPCDGSEIFETFLGTNDDAALYLMGYLTANATGFTNAANKSTATTGTWEDVDVSGDGVPADANGVFFQMVWTATNDGAGGVRNNGETYDQYWDLAQSGYGWTPITSQVFEQKIETGSMDLYVWGYTTEPVAAAAPTLTAYRARNDDGSESTATWAAAENTPVTIAPGEIVRLRMQIDEPVTGQYRLEAAEDGTEDWFTVEPEA